MNKSDKKQMTVKEALDAGHEYFFRNVDEERVFKLTEYGYDVLHSGGDNPVLAEPTDS